MPNALQQARAKAARLERLTLADALQLYQENDLLFLADCARRKKEAMSGKNVFYNVNRHINLTNVCTSHCPLCAFQKEASAKGAFTLSLDDVARMLDEAAKVPRLDEIHIVSALHPDKPYAYYREVVRLAKQKLPWADIKAFTPVEIVHFAQMTGRSVESILRELKVEGLSSLPGGGAEILSDRVRALICPHKATAQEWLETMRTAHHLGIRTNASIMYGHVETIEERLQHLFTLRDLQDETGGFQAFVAFPFHPQGTELAHLQRVGAWEDLKLVALARLILDNIAHLKAFWIMLTMPIAQLALGFGADDLDGTIGEEKIIHAAGAKTATGITRQDLRRMITEVGYVPVERDTFYHPLSTEESQEGGSKPCA